MDNIIFGGNIPDFDFDLGLFDDIIKQVDSDQNLKPIYEAIDAITNDVSEVVDLCHAAYKVYENSVAFDKAIQLTQSCALSNMAQQPAKELTATAQQFNTLKNTGETYSYQDGEITIEILPHPQNEDILSASWYENNTANDEAVQLTQTCIVSNMATNDITATAHHFNTQQGETYSYQDDEITTEILQNAKNEDVSSGSWFKDLVEKFVDPQENNEVHQDTCAKDLSESLNNCNQLTATVVLDPQSYDIGNQLLTTNANRPKTYYVKNPFSRSFQPVFNPAMVNDSVIYSPHQKVTELATPIHLIGLQGAVKPYQTTGSAERFQHQPYIQNKYTLEQHSNANAAALKRKRSDYDKEPRAKILKEEEDLDSLMSITKSLPVYRSVHPAELDLYDTDALIMCKILLPYEPYPYEPKLSLDYVGDNKFLYSFHTAEDPNTNKRMLNIQASEDPLPPLVWCLECGRSFTRSTSATRHCKSVHKRPPMIRTVFLGRTDE